ncbi:class I mannose-6-phosphate isomerase [Kaistia adipata]|uniref:class I mannose-6-phosphate isomerase n=1 Tax=Kaistia adipata TaxID=166954 RepID=UPI000424DB0E|nr:class I mannose-6-phosphate isomerase [Kaistia adipata]
MAIEHARVRAVRKPWGRRDLAPWSAAHDDAGPIGELWFQRATSDAAEPRLLLKLLFTSAPLSIQVHPDDAHAQAMGLPHGKTEAWYVLSAEPDAAVAAGLKRALAPRELRAAIEDGSIAGLVQWHAVHAGDAVFIPAGTIHAIGPGLVLAEIQQRSDTTFRLFDYGRARELHVEEGVAVADAGPAPPPPAPRKLGDARTLLVASPYFVLERVELGPDTTRILNASRETWILGLAGDGSVGPTGVAIGEVAFLDRERCTIHSGSSGLRALVAYPGPEPCRDLFQTPDQSHLDRPRSRFGASVHHH